MFPPEWFERLEFGPTSWRYFYGSGRIRIGSSAKCLVARELEKERQALAEDPEEETRRISSGLCGKRHEYRTGQRDGSVSDAKP